jgi:hypothetical protein
MACLPNNTFKLYFVQNYILLYLESDLVTRYILNVDVIYVDYNFDSETAGCFLTVFLNEVSSTRVLYDIELD